jgi:cysteine-rich repeat protein
MMPATRDICLMMSCVASRCGDGFTDPGRTPPEQCDDGNTTSGDGCSATCQTEMMTTPPTGFRITNLDLISPRIVVVPLFGCNDVTQTPTFGFSVNGELDTAIRPMSMGGDYDLHIVDVFRPLAPAMASTPSEIHFNPMCMEAPTPDSCGPAATPDIVTATAMNQSAGNCFVPIAADVNTRAGTPAAYVPGANTVGAPCFVTNEQTIMVTLAGIVIPLQRARFAATYSGTPPTRLITGVVTGFLSDRAAADIILPATLPVVGGDPLYEHLQAGNRTTTNSMGATIADGCNVGGGTSEDDGDFNGATRGFWFFLNFEAELVTWTGP